MTTPPYYVPGKHKEISLNEQLALSNVRLSPDKN